MNTMAARVVILLSSGTGPSVEKRLAGPAGARRRYRTLPVLQQDDADQEQADQYMNNNKRGRHRKRTILSNEAAFNAAPPTGAPSISGCAMAVSILSGLTEPPYSIRTDSAIFFRTSAPAVARNDAPPAPAPWWPFCRCRSPTPVHRRAPPCRPAPRPRRAGPTSWASSTARSARLPFLKVSPMHRTGTRPAASAPWRQRLIMAHPRRRSGAARSGRQWPCPRRGR